MEFDPFKASSLADPYPAFASLLEARVVLEELSAALPSLRLAPDESYGVHADHRLPGAKSVHLVWD